MASVTSGTDTNFATGQNDFIPAIMFSFTPSASGNATLYYQWCDVDAICVAGNASIALTHLAAQSASILGYWDPSANATLNASSQNAAAAFFASPPNGAVLKISRPLYSTAGSDLLNLSSYLIMDPATDSFTFTLAPPSDGGTFDASSGSLTVTGSPSTVQTLASSLTYTPGTGTCVNLDVNALSFGTSCTNTSGVTFNYSLTDNTQATSSSASGTINIQALTTFFQSASVGSIYNILLGNLTSAANNCSTSTCHSAGSLNYWAVGTDAPSTYSNIMGASSITSHPLVIPGDPLHSAFYTAPCTGVDPYPLSSPTPVAMGGSTTVPGPLSPAYSDDCLLIYQWILEGAQLD
jgi:hypothetical protein